VLNILLEFIMLHCTKPNHYGHEDLRTMLRDARMLSPLGVLSPDFWESFRISNTPKYGGILSKGVFSKKTFRVGDILGEYRGVLINGLPSIANSHYTVHISKTTSSIDASVPENSSWPRLINCHKSNQKANVSFEAYVHPDDCKDIRVVIQVKKDIHKNHQILADYKM